MVNERRIFGERLKRQRERRGISLQAISESTKIATPLFAGLEKGDCSRWPAGLYSRAYVRAYAAAIGLNADETVEDFVALFSGKATADGGDPGPLRSRRRSAGTLRLAIAEEPPTMPSLIARRAVIAGGDLVVASSIALVTYVLLDPGVWLTAGSALAYHAIGRVVSDEPLVWWLYRRAKGYAPIHEAPVDAPCEEAASRDDVAVGSAASTTA